MKKLFTLCLILALFSVGRNAVAQHKTFVDVAGLNPAIKPGDNFFRYVNARWYDTVKIANDQAGVGSYSFLNIPQKLLLQNILDSVSKAKNTTGSIDQKVGDFYASGMDMATIDRRGYEPVKAILARIDAINSVPALLKFVAVEMASGNRSVISFGISPDNKNSSINIAHLYQGGTGLPEKGYYFKTDSATLQVQKAYKTYLSTLFQLTGSSRAVATKNADITYGIEKQLAYSSKTNVELRDVNANFNKVAVAAIGKKQANINWKMLLGNLGAATDSIDMAQPAYYDKLNAMLKAVSITSWKAYLKAATLQNYADRLNQPFVDASFTFNKVLSGEDTQKTRRQIMTANVDNMLGQALGQLYVKRYFNEDAKKRVLALVNNLQKAFENRINQLNWMSDSTKQKAKEKLYTFTKKIGYPDKWRNYDKVQVSRTKFFENTLSLNKNDFQFELAKLNKPVDKTEWGTTPSTVTAYYNPPVNEIVFPAGILQYPYFDFSADDAINYGGIGMVIGHEMTHAFDDQGAQYDKDGNVKNWWTKEDLRKFKEKTTQLSNLYSSFTVLDTVHIKGPLTLGENTADNGGVAIAYDAFKMTEQGKSDDKIDSFTPDQRFFLSIARIWRVKTRDAFLRTYVNTNPHSPAMWRVNGPLMNFAPFYKAFNIQPGDKNYKAENERVRIW
ncbi:M13 family metallopeptidase [Mucilaginibacter sp. RB4R14]|uniref:M13 family metallopeptidase n=1 Tax=Mucilaginibacter aurantiaciroseus TaxID=2949308 RepID=UPI00208FFD4E|nr:M13 family metallopeptidase [Mucilaginibacter aurantiaciroseus]MCO5936360.1 M13 family metallopeptidase [Mucilaginibacter aurantiaciroseus]